MIALFIGVPSVPRVPGTLPGTVAGSDRAKLEGGGVSGVSDTVSDTPGSASVALVASVGLTQRTGHTPISDSGDSDPRHETALGSLRSSARNQVSSLGPWLGEFRSAGLAACAFGLFSARFAILRTGAQPVQLSSDDSSPFPIVPHGGQNILPTPTTERHSNGWQTRIQKPRSGLFSASSAFQSCAEQSFTRLEGQSCELSARKLEGREMAETPAIKQGATMARCFPSADVPHGGQNSLPAPTTERQPYTSFLAEMSDSCRASIGVSPGFSAKKTRVCPSRMGKEPLSRRGELAVIARFPERFRSSRHGGGNLQRFRVSQQPREKRQ
jgi:hypothetical protein